MNSIIKINKIIFAILSLILILSSCQMGFESTQEPHENPFDPGYVAADGRLILGEPKIAEGTTSIVRIHWKDVHSDSILADEWNYSAYYFTDAEKEAVFKAIIGDGDPSSSFTDISGVTFDSDKDYEDQYFQIDISSLTPPLYFIVKFTKSDSENINYSNIVVYPTTD